MGSVPAFYSEVSGSYLGCDTSITFEIFHSFSAVSQGDDRGGTLTETANFHSKPFPSDYSSVILPFYEELNDLYSSPNIVRVIKSRRMRRAGHVARMGKERGCIGSWWGNRREGDHWGDLGVDGWIILGWISRRWDVGIWTGLAGPR